MRLGKTLVGVAIAAAATLGSTASADVSAAAKCTTAACVKQAAIAVTTEQVYGSLYAHYKALYPNALDWVNDGCSFPTSIKFISPVPTFAYGQVFEKSCDRHDFGYHNHRKSGVAKSTVDDRFRDNMYHQCDVNYATLNPARVLCRTVALAMYVAVSNFGGDAWAKYN